METETSYKPRPSYKPSDAGVVSNHQKLEMQAKILARSLQADPACANTLVSDFASE